METLSFKEREMAAIIFWAKKMSSADGRIALTESGMVVSELKPNASSSIGKS